MDDPGRERRGRSFQGNPDELSAYLTLSLVGLRDEPLDSTLQRVAQLARDTLPEHPEASVTLVRGDRARTAASTSEVAAQLDERQYDQGSGPCLDAAVSGAPISVTMHAEDDPYPEFRRSAQRRGITRSLSLGFPLATGSRGALNLYSSSPAPLSREFSRIAATFASITGTVLGRAADHHQAVSTAEQLQEALRSRAVIEQAKGIIMARDRCSADEAFSVLTRLSQQENVKLRVIARRLVDATAAPPRPSTRPPEEIA